VLQEAVRKRRENEGGFTLIELLIVIVILGVLSSVVVFAVGGISDKGNAAACKSDVKSVETAQEAYYASATLGNGQYAANTATLVKVKLLRSAPSSTNGYTVSTDTTGVVTATGACKSS
jgi:prepilin-type N-terminal cleavage/methylation domain-containing protein